MKKMVLAIGLLAGVMSTLPSPAAAQNRLIQEAKDSATGATLRVYSTTTGPRLEMQTPTLLLQKQLLKDHVVTTIKGRGESLTIDLAPSSVSVVSNQARVVAPHTDGTRLERARQLIANSSLAARAAELIGRIGFGTRSPIQPLLLTTRAFLLSARHDDSGTREVGEYMQKLKAQGKVVPVALGQRTPSDCWQAYGDELVNAYTDYVECVNNLKWYDPFGETGCAVVYEVRIVGAFTWYAGCVSLGGIIGK
ncbi:MAG TPA: hypothetical protein VFV78_10485 [Vicinamibacterales bacterium]|nr:hypothetical protein [Vicinamibacterales bacterium]